MNNNTLRRAVAGIGTAGVLIIGGLDTAMLDETPLERVDIIANERVETRQVGNVVETKFPWKKETGIKVKYDMGTTTAMERFNDKRDEEVITEVVDCGDGGFKIDILLNEKPNTNRFCYQIEGYEDYDFFYQPALTQEEIDDGAERPENIIGSYAV